MCSHPHQEYGDPAQMQRLTEAIDDLRAQLTAGANGDGKLEDATASAAVVARAALPDGNPWTRSLARGLQSVVDLERAGRRADARELVETQLTRSLPGRAELDLVADHLVT